MGTLRLSIAFVCAASGLGCNAISGVGDFSFASASSSGVGGGGGAGGAHTSSSMHASSSSGMPAPVPCAPELEDDFGSMWTPAFAGPGKATVVSGKAELTLDAGDAGNPSASFSGTSSFTFQDCFVSIDFEKAVDSGDAQTASYFGVATGLTGTDTAAVFAVLAGQAFGAIFEGGTPNASPIHVADPKKPGFVRVREAGGKIHFETSTDGVTWTPGTTQPTPSFGGKVTAVVAATGTASDPALPQTAVFSAFR